MAAVAALCAATSVSAPAPKPAGLIVFTGQDATAGDMDVWDPEPFTIRPDGTRRTQITFNLGEAFDADLTPDRRRILFSRTSDTDGLELMTMRLGAAPDAVFVSNGVYPKWSPDGRLIASYFPGIGSFGPVSGVAAIWVVRPDGSGERNITMDGYVRSGQDWDRVFAWSPDSRGIVFQAHDGYERTSIKVADLESGAMTLIGIGQDPDWSPRGDQIKFAQRPRRIIVVHPDRSGRRRLTFVPDGERVYSPIWSHDGRRLAFYSWDDRSESVSLYVVRADGSHRIRVKLPADSAGASQARWSPDDRWLAFCAKAGSTGSAPTAAASSR